MREVIGLIAAVELHCIFLSDFPLHSFWLTGVIVMLVTCITIELKRIVFLDSFLTFSLSSCYQLDLADT